MLRQSNVINRQAKNNKEKRCTLTCVSYQHANNHAHGKVSPASNTVVTKGHELTEFTNKENSSAPAITLFAIFWLLGLPVALQ